MVLSHYETFRWALGIRLFPIGSLQRTSQASNSSQREPHGVVVRTVNRLGYKVDIKAPIHTFRIPRTLEKFGPGIDHAKVDFLPFTFEARRLL